MKDFLKDMLRDFFIITTGILISATVFCTIFIPERPFGIGFLWQIIAMGVFSTLPHFIFFAKKELTKKQMLTRQIIHACVLLALLLTLAHVWGWVDLHNAAGVMVFITMVGFVYMLVTLFSLHHDKKVAEALNARLQQYRDRETQ